MGDRPKPTQSKKSKRPIRLAPLPKLRQNISQVKETNLNIQRPTFHNLQPIHRKIKAKKHFEKFLKVN